MAEQVREPTVEDAPASRAERLLTLAAFIAMLTLICLVAVLLPPPSDTYFDVRHLLQPDLLGWNLLAFWAIYAATAVALAPLRLDARSWLGRTSIGRQVFLLLASGALGGALVADAASVLPDQWARIGLRAVLWLAIGLLPLLLLRCVADGRRLRLTLVLALPGTLVVAVAAAIGRFASAPTVALLVPLAGMILATLAGLVAMPAMLLQGEVGDLDAWITRAERLWRWADVPIRVLVVALAKLAVVGALIVLQPADAAVRAFDLSPDTLLRSLGAAAFIVCILLLDRRLGLSVHDLARVGAGAAGVIAWALGAFGVVAAFTVLDGLINPHPGGVPGLIVVGLVTLWLGRRPRRRGFALAAATAGALAGSALAAFLPGSGADLSNIGTTLVIWLLGAGALVGVLVFAVRVARAGDRAMGVAIAVVAAWIGVRTLLMPADPQRTGWLNVDAWVTLALCMVAVLLVRGRPWLLIDGREIVLTVVVLTAIIDVPLVGTWWVSEPVNAALALLVVLTPALLVVRRTLWSLLTGATAGRSGGVLLAYAALAAFCLLVGGGALRLVVQVLDLAVEFLALPISMLLIAAAPRAPAEADLPTSG